MKQNSRLKAIEKKVREKHGDKEPMVVAVECYRSTKDGKVPDVTNRPLEEWELYKQANKNNGLITIEFDPFKEAELRKLKKPKMIPLEEFHKAIRLQKVNV